MSLRIVHIYGHGYGGAFVHNQLRALRDRGHQVSVIVPEPGPFVDNAIRSGIPAQIIPFGGSRVGQVPKIVMAAAQLVRALRRNQPDVVHTHLLKANVVGRVAAYVARVPVVVSQLGGPLPLEIAPFRWLDVSTAWVDTTIVASSDAIARVYRRYPHTREKVKVVYYGFDPAPFLRDACGAVFRARHGLPANALVVGMIAHMYPSKLRRFSQVGLKGHEVLIQAAPTIRERVAGAEVIIAGDEIAGRTGYRDRLEEMARRIGASEYVHFVGHVANVPEALAAMDVVAVPSLSENLGGAVEPLLMRKPVVASNVGGLPEVVIDGVSGRLVPPKDSRRLADAIVNLLCLSPEKRLALGESGRREVLKRFELSRTIDALEATYFDGVARSRRRSLS